jgi:hypothetical protein
MLSMAIVTLPVDEIKDWDSFHSVCQETLGFPSFYGGNMNAWIDCLSYLRQDEGMSKFTLAPSEHLIIQLPGALQSRERAPEVFSALIECAAFVNSRYQKVDDDAPLALVLIE